MIRKWKRNPALVLGILMVTFLLTISIFGRYFPFVDDSLSDILYILDDNQKPVIPPYSPSWEFPFGTDGEGRDLLSLLTMGAGATLALIFFISLIRYIIAIPLAVFAANRVRFFRGLLAGWNQLLSGVPTIFIVMLLVLLPPILFTSARPFFLVLVIALVEVGRVGKIFEEELLVISKKAYVESGVMVGCSPFQLFRRYYYPQISGQIIVNFCNGLGRTLFLLAQLGFVSIFVSQAFVQLESGAMTFVNTSDTWPILLTDITHTIRTAPWIPFFATLAITFTILSFYVLSEGLLRYFQRRT
ncbi:ABC transporter permease [Lentibacillus sp. Marseille-P4043]|uniref:ABC transporter permease n=1 Tax=Lentibacillus sp. Marseille-P4043 TaxID=2040293 RepID=UPI00131A4D06|nr:ABC transporter permease subunit [Lentibacillus sp. Marseille-P4043]